MSDQRQLEEIKKLIRSLLVSAPSGGLSFNQLQNDFESWHGKPIPFRELGYNRLFDLLRDLTDVVNIIQEKGVYFLKGIATSRDKNIQNMVSNQLNPKKSRKNASSRQRKHTSYQINSMPRSKEPRPRPTSSLPAFLRSQIENVVTTGGIMGSCLNEVFVERYGHRVDYKKFGFSSLKDMLRTIPTITLEENEGVEFRIFRKDAEHRTVHKILPQHEVFSFDNNQKKIPVQLIEEIKKILSEFKNGLWAAQFLVEYKNSTGKELSLKNLGYYSVIELVSAIPNVYVKRPAKNCDWLLFDAAILLKDEILETTEKISPPSLEFQEFQEDFNNAHCIIEIPKDAAEPNSCFGTQKIPSDYYLDVYVSNIISPSLLCIQLKDTSTKLDKLMDDIEKFYSNKEISKNYTLPEFMVNIRQVCCTIYKKDGNWHRALITAIPNIDKAEVLYVDYGTTAIVPKSQLKILKRNFLLCLPAQAIQARLAYIKPTIGNEWSKRSRDRLIHLCQDIPLVAIISEIDANNSLSICLCDTSSEEADVHINDLLCAEGLALPETRLQPHKNMHDL